MKFYTIISVIYTIFFLQLCSTQKPYEKNGIYYTKDKLYTGNLSQSFDDSAIKYRGCAMEGLPHQKWKWYYPSSQLRISGEYFLGLKHGIWIWYAESGQTKRVENYRQGQKE